MPSSAVPATFDLKHIDPATYAAALGREPYEIFYFVRDHISFEAYEGSLRGPRGTLISLAGNAVDRASLLAALLEAAGHRVRFVRGTLAPDLADRLALSIWRQDSLRAPAAIPGGEPSAQCQHAGKVLQTAVARDYSLLREQLRAAGLPRTAGNGLPAVNASGRIHYWIQMSTSGGWLDLDPSFREAVPGRAFGTLESIFDRLPDSLFHMTTVKVRVDEHGDGVRRRREVLAHTARSADLSGRFLVLSHQPENWRGPVGSLTGALAATVEDTGRIKPVLVVNGRDAIIGDAFQQTAPRTQGMGGLRDMLAATSTHLNAALLESLEFEFRSPDGKTRRVTRELFDLAGPARREAAAAFNNEEVQRLASSGSDVTQALYSIFVSTGRIHASHLVDAPADGVDTDSQIDVEALLARIHVTYSAAADNLLPHAGLGSPAVVVYPDTPRVYITELSNRSGSLRLTLDLRSDEVRAISKDDRPGDEFMARVLRGVVSGTVERIVLECIGGARRDRPGVFSASRVVEMALERGIPLRMFDAGLLAVSDLPPDARARVAEEIAEGYLIIGPAQSVPYDKTVRYAWWRIDPRTGTTTAVTDEGLHQVTVEVTLHKGEGNMVTVRVTSHLGTGPLTGLPITQTWAPEFIHGSRAYYDFLWWLLRAGAKFPGFPLPL